MKKKAGLYFIVPGCLFECAAERGQVSHPRSVFTYRRAGSQREPGVVSKLVVSKIYW